VRDVARQVANCKRHNSLTSVTLSEVRAIPRSGKRGESKGPEDIVPFDAVSGSSHHTAVVRVVHVDTSESAVPCDLSPTSVSS